MNQSMLFKKLALSALLVSAVAVPTVTNAASEPKEESPKVLSQINNIPVAKVFATAINVSNPLELAKTYAPHTLEDWKETLEQYKKVDGVEGVVGVDGVDGVDGETYVIAAELTTAISVASAESNSKDSIVMEKTNLEPSSEMKAVESTMALATSEVDQAIEGSSSEIKAVESTMALPISEVDQAFFKAQFALDDAAKSKDATAIKEALAKLLIQYKQQIADFETAK